MCKGCNKKAKNIYDTEYKPKKKRVILRPLVPEDLNELFFGFGNLPDSHAVAIMGQPREIAETIRNILQ